VSGNGSNGHGRANGLNGTAVHTNGHRPFAGNGRPPRVVVLAGGRGRRLAPYTSVLPKPLMPIGDRSILEIVVDQLSGHGVTDVTFCVGYLSHLIRAVFDSREANGVRISYVQEEHALGTAAPLRLIDDFEDDTFVVMNGDVLTTLDFAELVRRHREEGNLVTVATRERRIKIDYGVVHLSGGDPTPRIESWEEKPEIASTVSMGIYAMEPRALDYIPRGSYFDFPDLIQVLLDQGEKVGAFPYDGLWFDIGRQDDYEEAVAAWETNGAGVLESVEVISSE
jgi:NDP-sugar pyrophosphorylase family protein